MQTYDPGQIALEWNQAIRDFVPALRLLGLGIAMASNRSAYNISLVCPVRFMPSDHVTGLEWEWQSSPFAILSKGTTAYVQLVFGPPSRLEYDMSFTLVDGEWRMVRAEFSPHTNLLEWVYV